MNINIIFQKTFIKKRFLFRLHKENYKHKETPLNTDFELFVFNKLSDIKNTVAKKKIEEFLLTRYGQSKLKSIISSPFWFCFFILEKKSMNPAGIGWLICNHIKPIWYDNLPTSIEESRLADHYILSKYQGNKLGKHLSYACYNYAIKNEYNSVTAHVESYNKVSLYTQKKFAAISGVNYLIKFFGINLFSVLAENRKLRIWYVGPGYQRKLKFD